MDKEDLKDFFAEFWSIDKSEITDDLRIDDTTLKNQSSIRFYQFIAAIESNFDVRVKDVKNIQTFNDLLESLGDKQPGLP